MAWGTMMTTEPDSKIGADTAGKRRPPNAGKGRPKGAVNRTTATVKAALLSVYDKIGGDNQLATWARENPTEFYKLWAKMLPTEVSGPDGGPIQADLTARLGGLSTADREALRAAIVVAMGKQREEQ